MLTHSNKFTEETTQLDEEEHRHGNSFTLAWLFFTIQAAPQLNHIFQSCSCTWSLRKTHTSKGYSNSAINHRNHCVIGNRPWSVYYEDLSLFAHVLYPSLSSYHFPYHPITLINNESILWYCLDEKLTVAKENKRKNGDKRYVYVRYIISSYIVGWILSFPTGQNLVESILFPCHFNPKSNFPKYKFRDQLTLMLVNRHIRNTQVSMAYTECPCL